MTQPPDQTEYVYLIGSEASPLVKIGRSIDVAKRFADIQRMSPAKLTVLWQTEGGAELETALHRHFRAFRSHGEWFELPDHDAPSQVMQAIVEIAAEEQRQRAERRATRKARKARRVWNTPTSRRFRPKRGERRPPDTLDGFLVGDVVKITRDGWEYAPTGVILAIWTEHRYPFLLEENDGRHHYIAGMFRRNEIARQSAVSEQSRTESCTNTDCFCSKFD